MERLARIRALTPAERALAYEVFGEGLVLDRVRVFLAPWPIVRAFVPGRWFGRDWIVWPNRSGCDDLARGPLSMQAVLVHELVHVWQAQNGVKLLWAKLKAGDSAQSYIYPVSDSCHWGGLNIEQQAMVVEHRFRLSRGLKVPADGAFYDRVCPIGNEPDRKIIV